jgi:hypothetical protein
MVLECISSSKVDRTQWTDIQRHVREEVKMYREFFNFSPGRVVALLVLIPLV